MTDTSYASAGPAGRSQPRYGLHDLPVHGWLAGQSQSMVLFCFPSTNTLHGQKGLIPCEEDHTAVLSKYHLTPKWPNGAKETSLSGSTEIKFKITTVLNILAQDQVITKAAIAWIQPRGMHLKFRPEDNPRPSNECANSTEQWPSKRYCLRLRNGTKWGRVNTNQWVTF